MLQRIDETIKFPYECLVVVDSKYDSTIKKLTHLKLKKGELKVLINTKSKGFSNAIKLGFSNSSSDILLITMADGSDDPNTIPLLVSLVERGIAVACASRYTYGGQQIGAPFLKSFLSKMAGKSFKFFTGSGTTDCTNNYKAFSKDFISNIDISASTGFEIGMELVAKARRSNLPIAETPTVWIERQYGKSKFDVSKQIKPYLKWYLYGVGLLRKLPQNIERNTFTENRS